MKKVCRNCKTFVKGNECPLCKGTNFSESWQGRLTITDAEKSQIAKEVGIKNNGEYVIKVR